MEYVELLLMCIVAVVGVLCSIPFYSPICLSYYYLAC